MEYSYQIDRVTTIGINTYVHFHQTIGDLALPLSRIALDAESEAYELMLVSADPDAPLFSSSKRAPEKAIFQAVKATYETAYDTFDSEQIDEKNHRVMFDDSATGLIVVLELVYHGYQFTANMNTGEVLSISSTATPAANPEM